MIRRTLTFIARLEGYQLAFCAGAICGMLFIAVLFVEAQMLLSMAKGGM